MEHKILAPSVGESITEVRILKWAKSNGQAVKPGDVLIEIESDKATVEVAAEAAGALKIIRQEGDLVKVGELLGSIDDAQKGVASGAAPAATPSATPAATPSAAPRSNATPSAAQSFQAAASGRPAAAAPSFVNDTQSPSVKRLTEENQLNPTQIAATGKDGRLTKGDVLTHLASPPPAVVVASPTPQSGAPTAQRSHDRPGDRRVPMSRIRARIAERLVQAQHTAAILSTFNEVDMTAVMEIRAKHKESFKSKHGVALSFMSFFTRAVTESLKAQPTVNASIDAGDMLYHDYFDIGIAVGTDRGLVVPVLRGADKLSFVEIEKGIADLAVRARDGKLSVQEMSGGTFTISNGGVYGSLLSTPILNPPQSGILGMHKIQERPVAIEGKVVVRPMMYLALSYDHRLIDGKEAVTFLVSVKDKLEKPESLGLEFTRG